MRLMHRLPALAACVLLSAPWRVLAQQAGETPPGFAKTEVEIPMRDGVHLHTAIYVPTAPHGVLPILFIRTPYGIVGAAGALRSSISNWKPTDTSSPSRTSAGGTSPRVSS